MIRNLSVLGSTGSIGRQSLAAAAHLGIPVSAVSANRNIGLLEQQARQFSPRLAVVYDESAARQLRVAVADTRTKVVSGMGGLMEAAAAPESDCVITAVSGSVGLRPTLAAIDAGKRIGLANKETLVCAGSLVMRRAQETGAEIVPVDSEHSAIFQALGGRLRHPELKRILLTASGGPFRGMTKEETYHKTPAEALRHPNWSMGAKITVDSATMMNKGLEFIEAMHLFGTAPCILSAANEAAVGLFLRERISFGRISECIAAALDSIDIIEQPALEDILASDTAARNYVSEKY